MIGIFKKVIQGRVKPGLILSLVIHGLVMLVPVSVMVVQRYEEIELYIMSEERPVIQEQRSIRRKMVEAPKMIVTPPKGVEMVREEKQIVAREELPKIDEKPVVEKIDIKEPVIMPAEPPPIPLFMSIATNAKETDSPNKPSSLSPQAVSSPKMDVRETVSLLKETIYPAVSQAQEVELGSGEGPKYLLRTLPVYPVMARRIGKEGKVVLRLTIDDKGNLSNVEVIENGGYGFTEAAVEAARKSSFLPALKDGKPVASRAILPIRFSLRSD